MIATATVNLSPISEDPGRNLVYEKVFREYLGDICVWVQESHKAWIKMDDRHPVLGASVLALAEMKMARNILEIGTEFGLTTIPLAHYSNLTNANFTSYESLRPAWGVDNGYLDLLETYITSKGLDNWIIIRSEFENEKHQTSEPYDFVFIDHDKREYFQAFKALVETPGLLTDDAWIVLHDVDPEAAFEYGANLMTNGDHLTWKPVVDYCLEKKCGKTTLLRGGDFPIVCHDLGLVQIGQTLAE